MVLAMIMMMAMKYISPGVIMMLCIAVGGGEFDCDVCLIAFMLRTMMDMFMVDEPWMMMVLVVVTMVMPDADDDSRC